MSACGAAAKLMQWHVPAFISMSAGERREGAKRGEIATRGILSQPVAFNMSSRKRRVCF